MSSLSLSRSEISALLSRLAIAHHIPGRIRLKLAEWPADALAARLAGAQALLQALERMQGIRRMQMNLLARSCTIEYDPARHAPPEWAALLSGQDGPLRAALLQVMDGLADGTPGGAARPASDNP